MEDFTPEEIAKSLRLLRYAKGWTLPKLERESGVNMHTFIAYEVMCRHPTLATVERVLVAMGCSWESLDLARALLREVGALGGSSAAEWHSPSNPSQAIWRAVLAL
jgi:transcriptional regulator with XRE-family HTH domain